MAELRPNRVKRKLREGKPAIVVPVAASESIERLGTLGVVDGVWIEMEHGPVTWANLEDFSRACDLWGMTSMVRLHHEQAGLAGRALDLGMQGIVIPHVSTKEEAQFIVHHAKYAPLGGRGIASPRQGFGVRDYLRRANDETMITILLEEVKALQNLGDILKVDGIDCFYLARGDLSQTMGPQYLGQGDHPDVLAVTDRAIKQIVAAGKCTGTTADEGNVARFLKLGTQFFYLSPQPYINAGLQGFAKLVKADQPVTAWRDATA
jgi:2-keto-3-deoxy-L-rhamnonate aldolase RhmA